MWKWNWNVERNWISNPMKHLKYVLAFIYVWFCRVALVTIVLSMIYVIGDTVPWNHFRVMILSLLVVIIPTVFVVLATHLYQIANNYLKG